MSTLPLLNPTLGSVRLALSLHAADVKDRKDLHTWTGRSRTNREKEIKRPTRLSIWREAVMKPFSFRGRAGDEDGCDATTANLAALGRVLLHPSWVDSSALISEETAVADLCVCEHGEHGQGGASPVEQWEAVRDEAMAWAQRLGQEVSEVHSGADVSPLIQGIGKLGVQCMMLSFSDDQEASSLLTCASSNHHTDDTVDRWVSCVEEAPRLLHDYPVAYEFGRDTPCVSLLVLLLFSPSAALQQWARGSLLGLLRSTPRFRPSHFPAEISVAGGMMAQRDGTSTSHILERLRWLSTVGINALVTLSHLVYSTPLYSITRSCMNSMRIPYPDVDNAVESIFAFGMTHFFLIFTELDQQTSALLRSLFSSLPEGDRAASSFSPVYLLLAGRLLFYWILRLTLERPCSGASQRTVCYSMCSRVNRLLEKDMSIRSAVAAEVKRSLLKALIHTLNDGAKRASELWEPTHPLSSPLRSACCEEDEEQNHCRGSRALNSGAWLCMLWNLAVALTPPTTTKKPGDRCSGVEWILRSLWAYAKGRSNFTKAVEVAKARATAKKGSRTTTREGAGAVDLQASESEENSVVEGVLQPLYALLFTLDQTIPEVAASAALYEVLVSDIADLNCLALYGSLVLQVAYPVEIIKLCHKVDLKAKSGMSSVKEERHTLSADAQPVLRWSVRTTFAHDVSGFDYVWSVYPSMVHQVCKRGLSPALLLALLNVVLAWVEQYGVWWFCSPFTVQDESTARAVDGSSTASELGKRRVQQALVKLVPILEGVACSSYPITVYQFTRTTPYKVEEEASASTSPVPLLRLAAACVICAESPQSVVHRFGDAVLKLFHATPSADGVFDADDLSVLQQKAALWCWTGMVLNQPPLQTGERSFLSLSDPGVKLLAQTQGVFWLRLLPHTLHELTAAQGPLKAGRGLGLGKRCSVCICWWLTGLICDVTKLDTTEVKRMCELVAELPPIPDADPSTSLEGSGPRLKEVSITPTKVYELLRYLYVSLLVQHEKCAVSSLVPALLHVAGNCPSERAESDDLLVKASRKPLKGLLRSLNSTPLCTSSYSSTPMGRALLQYSPKWLQNILKSVIHEMEEEARAGEQIRRNLEAMEVAAAEEQELEKRKEELRHERARAAAMEPLPETPPMTKPHVIEPWVFIRDKSPLNVESVSSGSRSSSNSSVDSLREALHARKKRKVELAATLTTTKLQQCSSLVTGTSPTAVSPTTVQAHRARLMDRQVFLKTCRQRQAEHESLLRRVAACTNVLPPDNPSIQDIVTNSDIMSSDWLGTLPPIPNIFSLNDRNVPRQEDQARYINAFAPHVFVDLRFNVHKAVWSLLEEGKSRAEKQHHLQGSRRPEQVGGGGGTATDGATSGYSQGDAPSGILPYITRDGCQVTCPLRNKGDAMDPTATSFTVRFVNNTSASMNANGSVGDGDLVLLLLPLDGVKNALRQRDSSEVSLPALWTGFGGFPQVCIVDSNDKRSLLLRAYPSSTLRGSGSAADIAPPILFSHVLHKSFTGHTAIMWLFPLLSLRQYVFTVRSLYTMFNSPYRVPLHNPLLSSPVARAVTESMEAHLNQPRVQEYVHSKICTAVQLNEWQTKAVACCLYFVQPAWDRQVLQAGGGLPPVLYQPPRVEGAHPLLIVEGPPGTGKTQATAMLLINLLRVLPPTSRVLVCAPSNCAVDEILLRLLQFERKERIPQPGGVGRFVRVGVRDKVDPAVLSHSPALYLEDVIQLSRAANTGSERDGPSRAISAKQVALSGAYMIFSTLGSLNQLEGHTFSVVVVDEASQATEPEVVQALALSSGKCILVGDSKQLQPTVLSVDSAKKGMERSLLSRLLENGFPSLLLRVQYRMHPDICKFPNEYVYRSQLITAESVLTRQATSPIGQVLGHSPRFFFFNVPNGVMERRGGLASLSNAVEARELIRYMRFVRQQLQCPMDVFGSLCGIISFYRAQCAAIRRAMNPDERAAVTVATVDSYQGKEMDIMLISCVRAPAPGGKAEGSLGFLKDARRINVALTRAKDLCVVFGHRDTLMNPLRIEEALDEEAGTERPYPQHNDARMLGCMISSVEKR